MKEKLCFIASDPKSGDSELKDRKTKYTSPHFIPSSARVEMDYNLGDEVREV